MPVALDRITQVRLVGWPLVGALLLGEVSLCLALIALYKKDQASWGIFLTSNPGVDFVIGGMGVASSAAALILILRKRWAEERKTICLTLMANAISALIVAAGAESMVRLAKIETAAGERVAGLLLIPKDWQRTRHYYHRVWDRASGDLSYLVYDAELGWLVADGRQSSNGLYRSGRNGVRTRHVGETIERDQNKKLIALVGDSFTFGEEVSYDETWGARLERLLNDRFQVLNFGVPGYGIDQMYLRYVRDVSLWKPDIVIFGFISNDVVRSTMVYPFLMFPEWDLPFSKPRFVQTPTGLQLINTPTIRPEQIFSAVHITDLPFLAYDVGYRGFEWERDWMYYSDFLRFVQARFPRWSRLNQGQSEGPLVALNREIVGKFLGYVKKEASRAILLYLPSSSGDFSPAVGQSTLGKLLLEAVGEPYIDPTPCLMEVPSSDRFVQGGHGHYSARGNNAVAACVAGRIMESMSGG
jgi:hypothetical protein